MTAVVQPKESLPNLKLDIKLALLARPASQSSEGSPLIEAARALEESREHATA